MSFDIILETKLEILHSLLVPQDLHSLRKIYSQIDIAYPIQSNEKLIVLESFEKLVSLNAKDPFENKYIDALSNLRDILLSPPFDFVEIAKNKGIETKIIINESSRLERIIKDIFINNEALWKIEHRTFEEITAELLRKQNYEVELTKATKDGGYDIILLKNLDGYPLKFLVECKRYKLNRPVGIEIVRSFSDVIREENANKGIIVTTSYFSKDVIKRQQNTPYLLDLRDRNDVINWINDYCKNK